MMQTQAPYEAQNKIRIVTAASLFDGHDAAINIMRRIMQRSGAEIIHLGHNRSAQEIVDTAIQEDVQGIAITSYQGGHIEFFKYIYDLLQEGGAGHIKIFGGGGGTILPTEIEELHAYGISRIYSPDDGRELGLQGMINDLLSQCDFPTGKNINGELKQYATGDKYALARLISAAENQPQEAESWLSELEAKAAAKNTPILGITGTGGAGKSSLVDELVRRFLLDFEDKRIAVISVDPSKRKTGGALLGDRIRMNAINSERVYMRSLATRQSNLSVSKHIGDAVNILKAADFDLIILETSGIGQSDTAITDFSDASLYVMTPEYGAATQLEKIDMLDFADLIALNKFDKRGAQDALRDVRKQYRRNHNLWEAKEDDLPVFGTIASQFNDPGMNSLYKALMDKIVERTQAPLASSFKATKEQSEKQFIIPPARVRYLSEISESIRRYNDKIEQEARLASQLYQLKGAMEQLGEESPASLKETYEFKYANLSGAQQRLLEGWKEKLARYQADEFVYKVRNKEIRVETFTKSLSHSRIPRIALPKYSD
ncbi:methylmalonyl-CoA mutase family protein [Saprospira grandis]|nr:cobalamin-dependent protein [Saprospira grandis]WBM76061.1 methylmalonyl-CoA mutase family protein [Saprospira grandis]